MTYSFACIFTVTLRCHGTFAQIDAKTVVSSGSRFIELSSMSSQRQLAIASPWNTRQAITLVFAARLIKSWVSVSHKKTCRQGRTRWETTPRAFHCISTAKTAFRSDDSGTFESLCMRWLSLYLNFRNFTHETPLLYVHLSIFEASRCDSFCGLFTVGNQTRKPYIYIYIYKCHVTKSEWKSSYKR